MSRQTRKYRSSRYAQSWAKLTACQPLRGRMRVIGRADASAVACAGMRAASGFSVKSIIGVSGPFIGRRGEDGGKGGCEQVRKKSNRHHRTKGRRRGRGNV